MKQILELREWVELQCKTGNPISCAEILNKIDEVLELDIEELLVTSCYEME
jgi:hypothetical protein